MSEREEGERQMAYDAGFKAGQMADRYGKDHEPHFYIRLEEYQAGDALTWRSSFERSYHNNGAFHAVATLCACENHPRERFLEELVVALLGVNDDRMREMERRHAEMMPYVFVSPKVTP